MRVALYSRVSTANKQQDTENQMLALREYCQRQGYEIVVEYVDHVSAKSGDRDRFKAMFDAAYRREFDLVLFWSLDRFSREGALATLQYLEKLTSYGVHWRSHTEQYLDSAGIFKDAILAILATLAKQERIRISERVKAGMDRARKEGKEFGRPRRIVDREKVRQYREEGRSLRWIAKTLKVSVGKVHQVA